MAVINNLQDLTKKVDVNDLKLVASVIPNSDDWLGKIERITTSINSMLDTAIKLKNQNSPKQDGFSIDARKNVIDNDSGNRIETRIVENPKQKEKDVKKQQAISTLVDFFDKHINECAKENPNMTFGEMLLKIPVNVTQLQALMLMIKSQLEGK